MTALLIGLAGLVAGPLLHGLAVQAGSDAEFHVGLTCPKMWPGRGPISMRCVCGPSRWREVALGLAVGLASAGMTVSIGVRPVLIAFLAMVAVTANSDRHRSRPLPDPQSHSLSRHRDLLRAARRRGHVRSGSRKPGQGGRRSRHLLRPVAARLHRGEGRGLRFRDVKLAALLGMFSAFQAYRVLAWSLIITAVLGLFPRSCCS